MGQYETQFPVVQRSGKQIGHLMTKGGMWAITLRLGSDIRASKLGGTTPLSASRLMFSSRKSPEHNGSERRGLQTKVHQTEGI